MKIGFFYDELCQPVFPRQIVLKHRVRDNRLSLVSLVADSHQLRKAERVVCVQCSGNAREYLNNSKREALIFCSKVASFLLLISLQHQSTHHRYDRRYHSDYRWGSHRVVLCRYFTYVSV